jgi:hypothetical protein
MLDTPTEPAKMRALHSSSALVVNVFDYWRERDPDAVARSLNIDPVNPVALSFEKQLRTGMRGTPPTLDLVLKAGECLWAVESKFTEPYQSHAHDAPFRESYFAKGRKRWAEVDLPRCQELAETMHCGSRRFARLDAAQLMKHALGVRHACPSGELLFLWYDVDTPEARELEREIAEFASAVDGALGFRALRYQDVLPRLLGEEAACREYRGYTSERYL